MVKSLLILVATLGLARAAEHDMTYMQRDASGEFQERTITLTPSTFLRVGGNGTFVVDSASDFKTALGLGTLATQNGTFSDAVMVATDQTITGNKTINGSLTFGNSTQARSALGLGTLATQNGTISNYVLTSSIITEGGVKIGSGSVSTDGGGAIGNTANATGGGGAVGAFSQSTDGGGAIGLWAYSKTGGAAGSSARSIDGFAGGYAALAAGFNSVQLGTGTNSQNSTIQFLSGGSVNATQWGYLAGATATGGALLTTSNATTAITSLGLGTLATQNGTFSDVLLYNGNGASLTGITASQVGALSAEVDPSFTAWLSATPPVYPGDLSTANVAYAANSSYADSAGWVYNSSLADSATSAENVVSLNGHSVSELINDSGYLTSESVFNSWLATTPPVYPGDLSGASVSYAENSYYAQNATVSGELRDTVALAASAAQLAGDNTFTGNNTFSRVNIGTSDYGWRYNPAGGGQMELVFPGGTTAFYQTGSPAKPYMYFAGTIQADYLVGAISGVTINASGLSGTIPFPVMSGSMGDVVSRWMEGESLAGLSGITYAGTGPNSSSEPTPASVYYYPAVYVTDGGADVVNSLAGKYRTPVQLTADLAVGQKVAVPSSISATGRAGDYAVDADYLYICTATNTWRRTVLTTW